MIHRTSGNEATLHYPSPSPPRFARWPGGASGRVYGGDASVSLHSLVWRSRSPTIPWEVNQPWVRLGQGWMLIVMTVCLWNLIRNRTHLRASNDSCGSFLLRSLKMKTGRIPGRSPNRFAHHPGGFGELVGWRRRTEGACDGSRSVFSLLSVFDERLADDRHVRLAAILSGSLSRSAAKKASAEFEALRQRLAAA